MLLMIETQRMVYTMEPRSLIPSWSTTPLPNITLSASGLLVLADLRTISRRTALTGGASWIDSLVLAPGLHYQQACDDLEREAPIGLIALSTQTLDQMQYAVKNTMTASYLKSLVKDGAENIITLDVGLDTPWDVVKIVGKVIRKPRISDEEDDDEDHEDWASLSDVDWLSHLLYLASPLITSTSIALMVIFEDWWGLAILLTLISSRILNIWAIKQRMTHSEPSPKSLTMTEYTVDLGGGHSVRLRGPDADLQALVTHAWLRTQSSLEGYLEAAAKLMVYMSAALGGNMTQAGAIVLIGLLLTSAALLGLSNAHARGFRMHGRYAMPQQTKMKAVEVRSSSTSGGEAQIELV
ncbi:hypothetical protein FOXG_01200 [Fusarium oxysporum f. sp. lycopersici 4287]|uniref:Uncharacterized protein n=4 Tax=Fusarium oxysporum TaxID=5507 RepID=A0A0J9UAC2_FUSO4|nr:hypothetical protein FOXG_01200 [Fusarium oxysporum f. sp. lycopersici 4287]EXK49485.1 hypothetical protein FOMG_02004 [Fusarium oxysporum f. sp. melonis 26406]KNA95767.1 hypothetical protein FOXG_01200 [Fusarium oxysporum f. sp. lycopersici 4287]